MGQIDERSFLPGERPSTSVPDPALHVNVTPGAFGGATARGLEQFGQSAMVAGEHWGKIAADDVTNQFEETARKIAYGDPTKTVTNPDGTQSPDLGYHGLKGAAALDQRAAYEKQLTDARQNARSKLLSADEKFQFDQMSRRYANVLSTAMSRHAETQATAYAGQVQQATIKQKRADIVLNADNEEGYKHAAADLIDAHRKLAQTKGATPGDALWNAAEAQGRAEAATERIATIGATDPLRASRMVDEMKGDLGVHYGPVKEHFRVRANQQLGRETADAMLTDAPLPAGDDAKAVLRHFEGFREKPYWDRNHWRVGYGSDTITKADGTKEEVTEHTQVTREDAERDLDRRAAESQSQARTAVGGEAFDKLSPQAKASLTSISYNYGPNGFPQTVADAARTGDPEKLAQAIRGLSGHNNGVNASRRAREANNISPSGTREPRDQADLLAEIENRHMTPEAEAAAKARVNSSYATQHKAQVADRAAFKMRVDDATAEALNTGNVANPIDKGEFVRRYGPVEGSERYAGYQSDVQFGADFKSMEDLTDAGITQLVNARGPQPGEEGYDRKLKNQERLTKAAALVQKQRSEDPAGTVGKNGAVKEAFQSYDPQKPETFKAVIAARLAAQDRVEIPKEVQSAITDAEAKQYAAALKPVVKEGAEPRNQEQVINSVVEGVVAKYGEHAAEAMARVLYHVTMKKDAAEVLSNALVRNIKGEDPQPSAADIRKIQIERDAERAAQIAATREERMVGSGAVGPDVMFPDKPAPPNPEQVGRVVNQADQKTQKPFSEAIDMLRSDPSRYMPYFVQKFGVTKVPADLQQYLPKPEPVGGR